VSEACSGWWNWVGRRVVVCLEGSSPSRSHRVAVLPGVFYPHGRLSRFNELPGFLNKLFGAFDDTLIDGNL